MRRIQQILLVTDPRRERSNSTTRKDEMECLFLHRSDNTFIRPYCLYPLLTDSRSFLNQHHHPPSFFCPPHKRKQNMTVPVRPKGYQRMSLHRAKAKQLSSYGGNCFSLGVGERSDRLLAEKQEKKPIKTSVSIVFPQTSPYKYLQSQKEHSVNQPKGTTPCPFTRRKISDRRVIPSRIQHLASQLAREVNRLPIDAWETFEEDMEE